MHSMSAGVWLGGSVLYFLKSLKYKNKKMNTLDFISDYNSILLVSSIILFSSGVIIAFDRLTYGDYSSVKAILLLVKVFLTFLVLLLTWSNKNSIKEYRINPSIFLSMAIYLIATILSVY
jgi:putative copper export protein